MVDQRRRRNSLRLQGYDYAWEGAYFVTICTHERQHLFGEITDGVMCCNAWGEIVAQAWQLTLEKRSYVQSPASVVMPNHFHALVIIDYQDVSPPDVPTNKSEPVGGRGVPRPTQQVYHHNH